MPAAHFLTTLPRAAGAVAMRMFAVCAVAALMLASAACAPIGPASVGPAHGAPAADVPAIVSDTQAARGDEGAILAVLVEDGLVGAQHGRDVPIVMRETLVLDPSAPECPDMQRAAAARWRGADGPVACPVSPAMLASLLAAGSQPSTIAADLPPDVRGRVLSRSEWDALSWDTPEGVRHLVEDLHFAGRVEFSPIVFDAARSLALCQVTWLLGPVGGSSELVCCERAGARWAVRARLPLWES